MTFLIEKKVKGKKYIYLEKSIRIGKRISKISKFLGKKEELSKKEIEKAIKDFSLEIDEKIMDKKLKLLKRTIERFEYPLTIEEVRKLERMNLNYHEIIRNLRKEDVEDLKKRFIANFVFESNAIEGNSLTLRNYQEIIFEKRIGKGADLREVYDAKNSYETFSWLFNIRKPLSEELIIEMHKKIMKNIDTRLGYKTVPNIILGKRIALCPPEQVKSEMEKLMAWYNENKDKIYPLELAFKIHHKFEKIHPFADGNGRVGRMILNYILLRAGFFPIIIRNNQRQKYLRTLEAADINKFIPLMRFAIDRAKTTYRKFFEIYYKYAKIKS